MCKLSVLVYAKVQRPKPCCGMPALRRWPLAETAGGASPLTHRCQCDRA